MIPVAIFEFVLKNWRVFLALTILAALAGALGYERIEGRHEGEAAVTQKIENANAEEMRRAQAAAKTVDDCVAAGGDWNRDRGVCDPAAGQ